MKNWTKEETDFLIKNYPEYGVKYCMEKLNRSKRSIELKKQRLNLKFTGTKKRWRKENIEKAVKKSTNYTQCLKHLGINNFGSSSVTLKKYIEKYNLDISHFLTGEELLKETISNNTIPLNDILVENSTYSNRTQLKNRLYKDGLKEKKCELCGQGEEWNGMKISLILDHINGINNDHRLENLRIVCPNCNAGLETHCRSAY